METFGATLTTCYPTFTRATTGGRAADGSPGVCLFTSSTPSERNHPQICLETMKTGETFRKRVNDSYMWSRNWPLLEKEDICNFPRKLCAKSFTRWTSSFLEEARWRSLVFTGIIRTAVNFIKFSCC